MKQTPYILLFLFLIATESCSSSSLVKIDGNSIKIEKGQYNYDSIDLTFSAELTDTIPPDSGVFWSRDDGRFHKNGTLTRRKQHSFLCLSSGQKRIRMSTLYG